MAVFTDVSAREVTDLLGQYDLGDLVGLKGIVSGIENSNFYLNTTSGKYVLTIFERLNSEQIPYYLMLTRHLGDKGLPVSFPILTKNGELSSCIHDKPCSIAPCLPGEYIEEPSEQACAELGALLAKLHLAVKDFPLSQENTKGLQFWLDSMPKLKPYIPSGLFEMLEKEVERQIKIFNSDAYKELEAGAVHADLFRNNSLIEVKADGEHIGGIIDFYFACNAPFLYDLAVVLNDWCINLKTGEFIESKAKALLNAYNSVKPLTEKEHALWQDVLCAAALRFWVSRLYDFYLPRQASLLKPHDPTHFERILRLRRESDPKMLPWI